MGEFSEIQESIDVEVPVSTAYNQWTQFETFPRFMEGIQSVRQLDDRRLHWKAEVGGKELEWDAQITEQLPDQRIAWRSITGAKNAGVVTFHRLSDTRCRVALQLDYQPLGFVENVGDFLGVISRRARGDLERFKNFIENRGEPTGSWRGEVPSRDARRSDSNQGMPKLGGEGDRESDRRYREAASSFAESGQVEPAARKAREALEGEEADELRRAERKGRHPAGGGS